MNPEHWPYTLEVHFEMEKILPRNYPQGVKMYFLNLQDAFSRCLLINPDWFIDRRSGISIDNFPFENSPVASITLKSKDGTVMLEVNLQQKGIYGGKEPPGIYYHFPEGILPFEKKLGKSLRDFKGYDPAKDHLIVSHLVNGNDLKPTIAFTNNRNFHAERAFISGVYPVVLHSNYFGCSDESPRSVDQNFYREVFYHKDGNTAIRHLLSLNFNQLSEQLAWEKDLPFYYSTCEVYKGSYEMASLVTSQQEKFTIYFTHIDGPGVYLFFKRTIPDEQTLRALDAFKMQANQLNLYKVGTYDKTTMHFGLDRMLELSLKPMPNKFGRGGKRKDNMRRL